MAIGGYFEFELANSKEYHINALRLNTGRNAFEYILSAKKYKKAYIPFYSCDVMLEPIKKLNLDYEFYSIDQYFKPVFNFSRVGNNEVFVYTNYFGICIENVKEVALNCKNLIIDNAQAFFSEPLPNIDTFYSVRKYFGTPDGSYLYTDKPIDKEFSQDISLNRFKHLIGRSDLGAEEFYMAFKDNEASLAREPIKVMSNITRKIMRSIDYNFVARKRIENFNYIHDTLGTSNILKIINTDFVPMVYPYFSDKGETLRKQLIRNKIFVPTYWPNVPNYVSNDSIEFSFTNKIVHLPIDQRYNITDMKKIIHVLKSIL